MPPHGRILGPEPANGDRAEGRGTRMRGELLGGRYRLGERLGGGGMGEVWAAEDVRMRRPVAAKLVDVVPGRYADQVERRFVHEVRSVANLPHRHTVTVHDCGEDLVAGRRTLYLVMEHVDGRDLRAVFHSGPRPAWYEVVDWAGQIGSALVAAHARGILHRDIKPQNAMLTGDGVVKVLDFGLAKILRDSLRLGELTASGTALGTLPYMSPEQCRGDRGIDHRTDLYSLGCLLYEGFTGRPPFTNPAPHALLQQQLYEAPHPLTDRNAPGVPPGIADLVASLLAKDPAHRPPDPGRDQGERHQPAGRGEGAGGRPAGRRQGPGRRPCRGGRGGVPAPARRGPGARRPARVRSGPARAVEQRPYNAEGGPPPKGRTASRSLKDAGAYRP